MKPEDLSPFGVRTEDIKSGSITADRIFGYSTSWDKKSIFEEVFFNDDPYANIEADPEDLEEEALMDPYLYTDAVDEDDEY